MSDWVLRILGAFYAVGGFFVLKQLADGRVVDAILAALKPGPVWPARVRTLLLTGGGLLTVASGLALLVPTTAVVPLMLANVAVQAAWLMFAAVYFPPEDDDDRIGRQRTTHAFVLYLVATVAVLWAERQGWVHSVDDRRFDMAIGAVVLALAIWQGWSSLGTWPAGGGGVAAPGDDEAPGDAVPFDPPNSIRLEPSVGCWPLWDVDTERNLPPGAIGLPEELVERIVAFDDAVISALDFDHDDGPCIVDRQVEAGFEAEAIAIMHELAKIFGDDNVAWRLPGQG